MLFVGRMLFRGIYFPQLNRAAWLKLLGQNLPTIASLAWSGWKATKKIQPVPGFPTEEIASPVSGYRFNLFAMALLLVGITVAVVSVLLP
jgi:hypothetical protein